jgi:3-oxoacyl-[acyl-carrier protein] reductase
MKLEHKVALVTGAGSGIGREIALTFAREGARVAINDIREEEAATVAEEIVALGGRALAVPADVADGRAALKMFTRFLTKWDTLDILVNNAGILFVAPQVAENMTARTAELLSTGRATTPLEATKTMEDFAWSRTLAVHLDGTFHCTREALKVMETRRSGRIINMASVAGIAGLEGSPDYSAAKAGIIGFTKAVAREVAGLGIRVNAIAPGFIETPLTDSMPEPLRGIVTAQTPAGRWGTVGEIAATALFLASEDADFMVGQVLSPNGGIAM